MLPNGFKEEDVNKYVDFLNYIAENAKFDNRTVKDQLEFVRLLQYQQSIILNKMQDAVVGEVKVYEPKAEPVKKARTSKSKTSGAKS